MAFRQTDFDGVVCAGNIEPSKCLIDYITGAGQFYVENPYYVQTSIRAGKKTPFVDVEYSGKQGSGQAIHAPTIFYHHSNGQYYSPSRYNILWRTNELGASKVIRFKAPYGGVDEHGKPTKLQESKSKIRTVSIGVVSRSKFDVAVDDQSMAVITFHLTEVLSILSYAYSFYIDLADAKYKSCKDNISFYNLFIDDINSKLTSANITKAKVEIDEDAIRHFNEPIAYIQDPDCFEDIKPTIPAIKDDDSYIPLWTLQRAINQFYVEARKNRIDASKYVAANRVNFMNKIALVNYAGNKAQLKTFKKDEDVDWKQFFIIKSDFTFLNTSNEEDREKCKGLCTSVFGDDAFVPIGSEEEMMTYYNALLRGEIYLSFEYKISLFAKSAYGLHVKTAMFDCVKEQASVGTMSAATRLAKERREREKRTAAMSTVIAADNDDDEDLEVSLSE